MLPNSINLFGKLFKIVQYNFDKTNSRVGEYDWIEQQIRLLPSLPESHKKETLLHELIHGIDRELNLNLKEDQVDTLSVGLFTIAQSNPHIIKYIFLEEAQ